MVKRMDEVVVGDRVMVSPDEFSEVFMFTHKVATGSFSFLSITTEFGSTIALSEGHYIYANGVLVPASDVRVGDVVQLASGDISAVSDVSRKLSAGLYNPQTLHGDIMVSGIRASTYTTAVEPRLAHSGLAPLRTVYRLLGLSTSLFDMGADTIAEALPSGVAVL
jgi:Hint module